VNQYLLFHACRWRGIVPRYFCSAGKSIKTCEGYCKHPFFMNLSRFDQSSCEELNRCVREIESQTDAELVVAVRARSSSYWHLDFLCGALLAYIALLIQLFSPRAVPPYVIAIDVALIFLLGSYICSHSDKLRRLLTTKEQRAEAVRKSAAAMFYEAGIANTQAEMGVLIYLSLMEERLELLADRGVVKAVPPLEWNDQLFDLQKVGRKPTPDGLLRALQSFGAVLARHLPPTGDNPNELLDLPRFDLK
jgi:putative membrane protein